jgi:hypothetical protein
VSRLKRGQVFIIDGNSVIHIAQKWRAGKEKNLFSTLFGKVVSTEEESKNTVYVGCKSIKATQANCQGCNTQYHKDTIAKTQYFGSEF